MSSIVLKVAASGLALATLSAGVALTGGEFMPSASAQSRSDGQAARLFRTAGEALQRGSLPEALTAMERAVALSPRDAGYRLLLADIYMRSGRFQSAETTYRDVLALNPGQNRAALTLALMQAANGRSQEALAQLEQLEGQSPADLGLAFALAGSPQRAIEVLEPAARAAGATARIRQNLALAYALGGDWQRARTIAAQDVSPAELSQRMTQWASLVQSNQPAAQVAAMIGTIAIADAGQPVLLALRTDAAPIQVAAAPEPLPEPVQLAAAETATPLPVQEMSVAAPAAVVAPPPAAPAYAELEQPDWGVADDGSVRLPAPDTRTDTPVRVQYAAASQALLTPAGEPAQSPRRHRAALSRQVAAVGTPVGDSPRSGSGRFVVQIGAFSSAANAERAWLSAERRFGLAERQPLTMTFDHNGRLLHRVAVAGFESRADAGRMCSNIRTQGGECFVRGNAGDAPIRWASRSTSRRRG